MNTNFSRILRKSNQLHFLWVFVMAQAVFVPSAMPATITDLGTLGGSLLNLLITPGRLWATRQQQPATTRRLYIQAA